MIHRYRFPIAIAFIVLVTSLGLALENNGFDTDNAIIDLNDIHSGGPAKDGIPSIDTPEFLSAYEVDYLQDQDAVIGLVFKGEKRAYPIRILNWHEIVNDRIGDHYITVTYCPLCGTGAVFLLKEHREFGVSGLLYNSDMLLYDRDTESLWSQILMQAISGPLVGEKLTLLASELTTWKDWKARYPASRVLSTATGIDRDYGSSPYPQYEQDERIWFPIRFQSEAYHPKERVLGVSLDGEHMALPYSELEKAERSVQVRLGKQDIVVNYDKDAQRAVALNKHGEILPSLSAFWFAWYAFHPDTAIFRHQEKPLQPADATNQ